MRLPNIKKLKNLNFLSYRKVVYASFWFLAIVAVSSIILDLWIFYDYGYNVVNEDISSDYTITLKSAGLSDIINVLDGRKDKFDSILKNGIKDIPTLLR